VRSEQRVSKPDEPGQRNLTGDEAGERQLTDGKAGQRKLRGDEAERERRGGGSTDGLAAEQAETAAGRRAAGALESAVLAVLWGAATALSPGEVREALSRTDANAAELSYSTVVTILTRLHEKGALFRERDGRAYRYAPVADEAGLAARRLSQLLDRSANREAVLSRFVADLSERDEELLRTLLAGADSAMDAADSDAATGSAGGLTVNFAAGFAANSAAGAGTNSAAHPTVHATNSAADSAVGSTAGENARERKSRRRR
jgi:predicted transcriptional regulator